ncbi:hypothetical protein RHMOL_Rhmol11G0002600 [Rhododendron molle]|uniref:Uncharacterized protein n=1 Tax=Rhododendron molle TaxID=49168 RepID=A0ACC0LNA8_RHOML|nr:hypothetical protein RHMOL_Rhmol11G0002600 [Rhododendron molle]
MHGEEDMDLGGFSFDTSGSILAINVDGDFLISSIAMDIMLRMSYFPAGNAAYTGQAEPFINPETGELLLGFEVFADDTWSSTDEEPEKAEFKRKLTQPKLKTD